MCVMVDGEPVGVCEDDLVEDDSLADDMPEVDPLMAMIMAEKVSTFRSAHGLQDDETFGFYFTSPEQALRHGTAVARAWVQVRREQMVDLARASSGVFQVADRTDLRVVSLVSAAVAKQRTHPRQTERDAATASDPASVASLERIMLAARCLLPSTGSRDSGDDTLWHSAVHTRAVRVAARTEPETLRRAIMTFDELVQRLKVQRSRASL